MHTLNFVVIDPRGPYLFWRDADGNAFTRTTAEAFAERHNSLLEREAPELDGNRLKVCELLPAGHRQRVCELSVELEDALEQRNGQKSSEQLAGILALSKLQPQLHDLAHEAA